MNLMLREYYDSYPPGLNVESDSTEPMAPDIHATHRRSIYPAAKRGLDILVTLIMAPFVLAVVGMLSLWIRQDGGDALFSQPRVGKNGRIFTLWKLRTMVPNAEQRLEEYLSENATCLLYTSPSPRD